MLFLIYHNVNGHKQRKNEENLICLHNNLYIMRPYLLLNEFVKLFILKTTRNYQF